MDAFLDAIQYLPPDYFVKSEAFTKTTYRDEYGAINPVSPALSQAGKVIVVTGASQGIGKRGLAKQFARAKPKAIVLAARNAAKLAETEEYIRAIEPSVQLLSVATDVTSEVSVKNLFDKVEHSFGHADVLVNNAGVSVGHSKVNDMELDPWWQNFEVNVKGVLLTSKYFLRLLGTAPGTIINISSSAAWNFQEEGAAYCTSKLATVKLGQQMAARPNVVTVALHPGMVETDIVPSFMLKFHEDTPELPGGMAVWLTADEAKFLSGRYVSANWSVDELVERKEEIVNGDLLKVALTGNFGADQWK